MQQRHMARYERKKSNLESDILIRYTMYLSHTRIDVGHTKCWCQFLVLQIDKGLERAFILCNKI